MAVAGGVGEAPLPPALTAQLREAALPEVNERYWETAARLVALGWLEEALELLGLHSAWLRYDAGAPGGGEPAAAAAVAALEAATLLLRRFPLLTAPGAPPPPVGRAFSAASELQQYRRTWQAQAAAVAGDARLWGACEAGDAATAAGLRAVLAVLAGEEAALAGATTNWLELLVAHLLHAYPTARPQAELRQLLQRCFDAGGGAGGPEFLQVAAAALEAGCEADAQAAMRVCSAFCSDWFMAHAPPLLAAHPSGGWGGWRWGGRGEACLLPGVAPSFFPLVCPPSLPPLHLCASPLPPTLVLPLPPHSNPSLLPHPHPHSLQAPQCWPASCHTWAAARLSFTASSTRRR